MSADNVTGEFSERAAARSAAEYRQVTSGATVRSREQIRAFFDGLELAEPGLVRVPEWRPEQPAEHGIGMSRSSAAPDAKRS